MSDGSLSQDEIDALLLGSSTDFSMAGGASGSSKKSSISSAELTFFENKIQQLSETQSNNLSNIMGKTISISQPIIEVVKKEDFLQSLPDEVVEVKLNFAEGVTGDHSYILNSQPAMEMAGLMMGQQGVELDDMSLHALGEAFSTLTGAEVTDFGDAAGTTIMPEAPESKFVPKAMLRLPSTDMVKVTYSVDIEGENPVQFFELFSSKIVKNLAAASGIASAAEQPQQSSQPAKNAGMSAQTGRQAASSNVLMSGMQMPNVQPVQFANFQTHDTPQEQGNINLLMDVSMELTVELGRTKKLIREILGMGEGTIIELDKLAGEPVDILVNHKLIAKGEVVVIDENFGVRVTEIVSPMERMHEIG